MGVESKFLEEALGAPWTLSTSQQPQSQTNLWDKSMTLAYFAPGGGFGPVSDKGYGVSYMVLDEYIFFHVTSKKSSGNTDSKEFSAHIHQALQDVIDVALP
ncbi:hypothetical protein SARC_03482 [Sphaeroforma arctica JP610]|uniref:Choline/carnitine acyltransferase domain-containing protein n=1 Tax=Sphaeroforma arctica JP610 TaxID=667725 RepID=A0A0L0G639_9EUKA|nr:hypothetical protein SARC_03482 [Sphaeroforma arctica JP610]KNC84321.1 hypothetical protein SARC_03482 [Sphaeroforma arctica JP610]|eukprot:XP_014158223.1 hypothetical protein SARC_03482 [Sphaeroforma arctica JP610]